MKKIGLLALGLALAFGVVAEAGSIPADRVPLQTYAVKKMNCYLQPNGVQKGWIDPGDYVVVLILSATAESADGSEQMI